MYQKIKTLLERYGIIEFVYRLQDVRFAGLVLFLIVVLLISWSGVKAIETNYQLQKQISALKQQTEVQRLKNTNLELQNKYYNTDQYLELSARQNFGLAAPGEKVLIVPKDVALSHTVPETKAAADVAKPRDKQPRYQRNLQAWVNFFLHRNET